MNIEVKTLMDENEMLSHIFLGCIPYEQLMKIKDKFVDENDWRKNSVKIPVELKIGGVSVNPKNFFDQWKDQMERMITKKARQLIAENTSQKIIDMQQKLYEYEEILKSWESDINWEVKNPFI